MTRDIRDQRDPQKLGVVLLQSPAAPGKGGSKLTRRYDAHAHVMNRVGDYVDTQTSLERYGDPVASHRERIAAGIEVELP